MCTTAPASGVRNSCAASATNLRCRLAERSSDASIPLSVSASLLSSSVPGLGSLPDGSPLAVIAMTMWLRPAEELAIVEPSAKNKRR